MRDGIMQHEVEKMKKQIEAGLSWDQIRDTLHPDDNKQIARERFYLPLKAEFDKLPPKPKAKPTTLVCPSCSAVNSVTKKFCGDCGTSFAPKTAPADADGLPKTSKLK